MTWQCGAVHLDDGHAPGHGDHLANRPHKLRSAARIIVRSRDAEGDRRVLLFQDTDPGIPGSRWWVTPGGGIDPGETEHQAAVRELEEETGLVISEAELQGPVARRVAVHGYSDQVLEQGEVFVLVDVDRFEVSTAGFTEKEKVTLLDHGWFSAAEMQEMEVWPHHLPGVVEWAGADPVDWGRMDESTAPVD